MIECVRVCARACVCVCVCVYVWGEAAEQGSNDQLPFLGRRHVGHALNNVSGVLQQDPIRGVQVPCAWRGCGPMSPGPELLRHTVLRTHIAMYTCKNMLS